MTYKIGIGISNSGSIKADTVFCLIGTIFETATKFPIQFFSKKGPYIHENRNVIVREARTAGCSHLQFIDADMNFPPSLILQLLSRDKDIIGVPYNFKFMPLTSTLKMADEEGRLTAGELKLPDDPFVCHSIATGMMLIRINIFDRIEPPWFFYGYTEKGEHIDDDVYFCEKAIKAGFKIWAEPTIEAKHIGDFAY